MNFSYGKVWWREAFKLLQGQCIEKYEELQQDICYCIRVSEKIICVQLLLALVIRFVFMLFLLLPSLYVSNPDHMCNNNTVIYKSQHSNIETLMHTFFNQNQYINNSRITSEKVCGLSSLISVQGAHGDHTLKK